MNDIFQPRAVSYSLRSQIELTMPNVILNILKSILSDIWLRKFGTC